MEARLPLTILPFIPLILPILLILSKKGTVEKVGRKDAQKAQKKYLALFAEGNGATGICLASLSGRDREEKNGNPALIFIPKPRNHEMKPGSGLIWLGTRRPRRVAGYDTRRGRRVPKKSKLTHHPKPSVRGFLASEFAGLDWPQT